MHTQEIQTLYEKHQLLTAKGKGIANALVGKTALILFFVNDSRSQWDDSVKNKFSKTHTSAMEIVMKEAQKRGVSLAIDTFVEEVTVPFDCDLDYKTKDFLEWDTYIINQYDRKMFRGYQYHFTKALGYDQVAIAFVFNRAFRAYARSDNRTGIPRTEFSTLSSSSSERTIIHELFHQFGAADLYYPDEVVNAVRKHNYLSLMGNTPGIPIDSLTAYLIGWSDEIDETTVALLEETKHLRFKDILIGRREN